MTTARPLRVGLAGAGWVSAHHLDAWTSLRDRAVVVAIADPDVAAARRRAGTYGIGGVHDSVEAMLNGEKLDAIDIATPRETHVAICRLAAAHGLAILCQKPLAPTLEEAEALVATLRAPVRLMVHENWRFRPHYRQIHAWLQTEQIGQVRTVLMALRTSGLLSDADGRLPALVRQPMLATLDRLLLMEVLIHHVDTLRFLLGPLTLVGAQLGRSCDAIRGEDRAALLMTTGSGASVSVLGDFMAHGYPQEQFDRLEILGTRGAIGLDRDRLQLRGETNANLTIDLAANYKASYAAAIEHFLDRLADGGPFETNPPDNLETLRIVEGAYRSERT